MSGRMAFNINCTVYVRLTEKGRDMFAQWAGRFGFPPEQRLQLPEPDERGYYPFQMWQWAAIFGPELYLGQMATPCLTGVEFSADDLRPVVETKGGAA